MGCYPGTVNIPGIRWFDKEEYAKKNSILKRFRSYMGWEALLFNKDLVPKKRPSLRFSIPLSTYSIL